MIKISERLKMLRTEHNLTKTKMAEIANVSLKTYLKWENGYSHIKSKQIIKYSLYFNVSVDFLVGISNNRQKQYNK